MEPEIQRGSVIAGFDYVLPVKDDLLRRQVDLALARGIPEAVTRKKLTIIANGPSARGVDLKSIKGHTLALNGSIGLFTEQGVTPTFWAGCDPQALMADFLPKEPSYNTVYFLASKCHPSLFDRLQSHHVRVWHIGDYPGQKHLHIAEACSVTISAAWLMHWIGYTDFEFWGWDGCFLEGKHHAIGNADWSHLPILHLNYGGMDENGEIIGGRTFSTTRSWAAEAKAAEQFFNLAHYFDIGIKINGDGMFECARKFLMDKAE